MNLRRIVSSTSWLRRSRAEVPSARMDIIFSLSVALVRTLLCLSLSMSMMFCCLNHATTWRKNIQLHYLLYYIKIKKGSYYKSKYTNMDKTKKKSADLVVVGSGYVRCHVRWDWSTGVAHCSRGPWGGHRYLIMRGKIVNWQLITINIKCTK